MLFAQDGKTISISSYLYSKPDSSWIIDSGASDHMTGNSTLFSTYKPCAGNRKVRIADGSFSAIAGVVDITISHSLILSKVLHVPNLSCNLISISKLTQDLKCSANFHSSHCVFQDLASRRTIGNARECDGLYILEEGTHSNKEAQGNSCLQINSILSNNEIYLLHF